MILFLFLLCANLKIHKCGLTSLPQGNPACMFQLGDFDFIFAGKPSECKMQLAVGDSERGFQYQGGCRPVCVQIIPHESGCHSDGFLHPGYAFSTMNRSWPETIGFPFSTSIFTIFMR